MGWSRSDGWPDLCARRREVLVGGLDRHVHGLEMVVDGLETRVRRLEIFADAQGTDERGLGLDESQVDDECDSEADQLPDEAESNG